MTISVQRVVHSVQEIKVPVEATTAQGVPVEAYQPSLIVELVGDLRTHTEQVTPSDAAGLATAKTLFVVGNKITVTYTVAE